MVVILVGVLVVGCVGEHAFAIPIRTKWARGLVCWNLAVGCGLAGEESVGLKEGWGSVGFEWWGLGTVEL